MTERYVPTTEEYDSEDLRKHIAHVHSLGDFRLLLKETLPDVPVEAFLYDFGAQIDLQRLMSDYAHKTKSDKEPPVVILKQPGITHAGRETIGGTKAIEVHRFRLNDPNHIYYFNRVPDTEPIIVRFMDQETQVFPDKGTEVYPLNRVPVKGGQAQTYVYKSRLWQPNGQGVFHGVGRGNLRMGDVRLPRIYGK